MARIRIAVMVTCVTLLSTCAGVAHAEGNRLNERYSQGLHAYYAGEFAAAHSALSEVIKGGFQNPCCYYFRGMVSYRQGDKQAAQQDFQTGAEREANASRQKFPISKSLERVQGGARVMIERARLQARFAVLQKRLVREKQRYEALVRNEAKVLRKAPAAPGAAEPAIEITSKAPNDPFVGGAGLTGSAVQADATAKPAAVGTGVIPGGNQEPAPAPAAQPEEANPFGEDPAADADAAKPAPAAQPDEANPFGEPADGAAAAEPVPAEQPAAAAPAAASGGNPLAAILRAFSRATGVEGLVPSAEQLGGDLEELLPVNPFGGGPSTATGRAATPAKPVENPFAEPAAEPSNPFDTPEEEAAAPAKPAPAAKPQTPAEENPFD